MNCKYCDSPTCEAERYPDDSRVLRICRHNVQLERDFFRNRLRRYEPVKADQPAATETANPDDDTCPCGQRYGEYGHDH